MRRWNASTILLATLAALSLTASSTLAAGFALRWDACAADGGATNKNFACDSEAGLNTLVASCTLDQPLTGVLFVEAVLDFIVAGSQPVPPWWEFFDCRFGGLTADSDIYPLAANCADWSGGVGLGVLSGFNHEGSIASADTASHRRITVVTAADLPGVNMAANQDYFLFNLVVDNVYTTDPGACAGCALPVCIVLNSLRITTADFNVTTLGAPQVAGGNFATWQGGTGANCLAVPAKRSTWGQVKALYR